MSTLNTKVHGYFRHIIQFIELLNNFSFNTILVKSLYTSIWVCNVIMIIIVCNSVDCKRFEMSQRKWKRYSIYRIEQYVCMCQYLYVYVYTISINYEYVSHDISILSQRESRSELLSNWECKEVRKTRGPPDWTHKRAQKKQPKR